jgi:hypothetical protein
MPHRRCRARRNPRALPRQPRRGLAAHARLPRRYSWAHREGVGHQLVELAEAEPANLGQLTRRRDGGGADLMFGHSLGHELTPTGSSDPQPLGADIRAALTVVGRLPARRGAEPAICRLRT